MTPRNPQILNLWSGRPYFLIYSKHYPVFLLTSFVLLSVVIVDSMIPDILLFASDERVVRLTCSYANVFSQTLFGRYFGNQRKTADFFNNRKLVVTTKMNGPMRPSCCLGCHAYAMQQVVTGVCGSKICCAI